jgi:hypothetical protein
MAIAVVVEERAAGVPPRLRLRQPRMRGHIGECAIAIVTKERVLSVVADKKIVEAIVVVVAHAAGLPPSAPREAGSGRHIGERAVAVVLEEMAGGFRLFCEALQPPAVDQKDVQPAIVVIVVKRHAAAGSFEKIFVLPLAAIDSFRVQSSLRGYIDELQSQRRSRNRRNWPRWRRHRLRLIDRLRAAHLALRNIDRALHGRSLPRRRGHP